MRSLWHASPPPRKMAARRVPPFHCSTAVGASCHKAPPLRLNKLAGAQRPRCTLTHALFGNRVPPHASDGTDNGSYVSAAIIAGRLCVLRPFSHIAVSIDKSQPTETRSTPMETINNQTATNAAPKRKGGFVQDTSVAQGCCGQSSSGSSGCCGTSNQVAVPAATIQPAAQTKNFEISNNFVVCCS
jgi:hypothetical protein